MHDVGSSQIAARTARPAACIYAYMHYAHVHILADHVTLELASQINSLVVLQLRS